MDINKGQVPPTYGAVPPQPPPYSPPGSPPAPIGFAPSSTTTVYAQPAGSVNYVTTQPAGSVTYVSTQRVQTVPVVVPGTCPACRVGILTTEFTVCGVLCAILFFPFGFICCALMTERRCSNCGLGYS